ncbi:MAG: NADAR family protein, partial [Planctomycetota bacterium]
TAETEEERTTVTSWVLPKKEEVFLLKSQDAQTFLFQRLGPRLEICQEPINVGSRSTDPRICLISNFARAPFELSGRYYESVEAFWQGLKFPDEDKREEIALLSEYEAKKAGLSAPPSDVFWYENEEIRVGSREHWKLMYLACEAKFSQNEKAKRALLSTGTRPLQHKMRKDSTSIPGVIMADIWMKIRTHLAKQELNK